MTEITFRSPRYFVIAAAITVVYFTAAEFGLSLASIQANVSPVWPPTGIAIAALLIFGRNFWPAILAGALAANLLTPASFPTAAGIGVGNTLEALTAWYLLKGPARENKPLDSIEGVLRFIFFAVIISPVVSATIGNVSLCLGGSAPWANFPHLWLTWWLGDGFGALVIAPFILSFTVRSRLDSRPRAILEGVGLLVLLFITAMVVFGGSLPGRSTNYPIEHLCLPLVVWAALRFDLRISCAAILLLSGVAVWGTSHGHGPFIQASINESLLLLQLFIGASTLTAFVLHAVVTERRMAEEEKLGLLERERAARAQAEQASRLKDEFLASTSHELRTPLTAIVGWSKLLRTGQVDPKDFGRAFEVIEQNAWSQARIVEDMLDVSRIITGKLQLAFVAVELEPIIAAAIDAVHIAAEAKSIKIVKRAESENLIVRGDGARLQQVAWNLFSNAVKFTPNGGIVEVLIVREGSHAKIVVADTGAGINPDFLPYVFERFTQADRSSTRQHGGLGLGLAIVRHLVELHGGTVEARNKDEGKGAVFTVILPASDISSSSFVSTDHGLGD